MTKRQKLILSIVTVLSLAFGVVPAASAMHIMEGYLPAAHCMVWGVICLPFVVWGFISIKNTLQENRRAITVLAMAGAFIFVISSLKIPSVTGSCSHMTGTGIIVLLFQAILLAHGGLTTLGANTFSMAIAGPFVSFGIYKLCETLKVNKMVSVFLAAMLGDIFTYCVTSLQLAAAYPSDVGGFMASAVKFLGVFAPTQLPLAVVEGILTVIIVIGLESFAKPELKSIGFIKEGR